MNIIICPRCKGCGQVKFDVGTHKSEYEQEECGLCKGSGRLEQKVTIAEVPFVPGKKCEKIF